MKWFFNTFQTNEKPFKSALGSAILCTKHSYVYGELNKQPLLNLTFPPTIAYSLSLALKPEGPTLIVHDHRPLVVSPHHKFDCDMLF